MSSIANLFQLTREGLHRVARNEPCSFNSVLIEQLQDTVDANGRPENTTRDVGRASRVS